MKDNKEVTAHELLSWQKVSLVLTGTDDKIRSNRDNKKFMDKLTPLLEMVQEWIDAKGEPSWANIEANQDTNSISIKIEKERPVNIEDYEEVSQIPVGRVAVQGQRGLYKFNNAYYTNKIVEGKLQIRMYKHLNDVLAYLESIKKE